MDDRKDILIREENLNEFLRVKDLHAPRINDRQVIGILWPCKVSHISIF